VSRTVAVRVIARLGRGLVAAALCAQLTHAVLYESVVPKTGGHEYMGWYAPLLVVLFAAALAFGPATTRRGGVRAVARLALLSALVLLVQESVERTISSGAVQLATYSALTMLVAIVALVAAATALVAVEHTLDALTVKRAGDSRTRAATVARPVATARAHRRRPLSAHGGLRAPPRPA
jgi:hypothetical protein